MLGLGVDIRKQSPPLGEAFENTQSLNFDGVNDQGRWPSASTFEDLLGNTSFTISAWLRCNIPPSASGSKGHSLLGQSVEFIGSDLCILNMGTLYGPGHSTAATRNTMHFSLIVGTTTYFDTKVANVDSYLTDNQWYHLAYTSRVETDGTRSGIIYIDGTARSTSDSSASGNFSSLGISGHYFGAKSQLGSITEYTRGFLDEFVILNEAAPASRILEMYNSGCPKAENSDQTIGYWRMEQQSGDALDTSSNSNDITRTGATFNSTTPC